MRIQFLDCFGQTCELTDLRFVVRNATNGRLILVSNRQLFKTRLQNSDRHDEIRITVKDISVYCGSDEHTNLRSMRLRYNELPGL